MAAGFMIRALTTADQAAVTAALYDAVVVPDGGAAPPPRTIVDEPPLRSCHEAFGTRGGDVGVAAVAADDLDGVVLGAAWVRLGYGHVDDEIPELSMSVAEGHRGRGIGSALLDELLDRVPRRSLGVDLANPAMRFHERHGFRPVRVDADVSAVMLRNGS